MLTSLRRTLPLLMGYKTKRRILVIESDDWGSVRTSNRKSYETLLKKGYPIDKNPYSKYDALEANDDVAGLLDVLNSVKTANGASPKITFNWITANPDFEAIRNNHFEGYQYESSVKTRKRYENSESLVELYSQGIKARLIRPQLHGREHVNITRWMRDLKTGHSQLVDAFEEEMFSLRWSNTLDYPNEYMDALDMDSAHDFPVLEKTLREAADLFAQQWNFRSKSFIACCYIWHSNLHKTLKDLGIAYLQGLTIQNEPFLNDSLRYKNIYHYTGQQSKLGQIFLTRNAFLDPSVNQNIDNTDACLQRIALAFKFNKPAIISSHRLNYIGRIFPENRDRGLKELFALLSTVVKRWPNVEFMFTDELGDLISAGYSFQNKDK